MLYRDINTLLRVKTHIYTRIGVFIGKIKIPFTMKKSIEKIVKHAEVSEKMIEQYLTDCIKQLGGICLKYSNPGMVGFPDRVCLLPDGVTLWVELKSKGQQLRTMQRIRITQMLRIGHTVNVCKSKEDIDKMLEPYKQQPK